MSQNRVRIVEEALGVKLPAEYADFVKSRGIDEAGGIEIYGYDERVQDVDRIPCVIGATRIYQSDYALAPSEIVVAHTFYEDEIIVLDTASGRVFGLSHEGRKQLAASVDDWLESLG